MRADKLTLNKNTKLEDVAHYFKNLGPDKQVRARELADGRIQLYVRNDSRKQFFTDKLKPDYLIKRDYLNARNQIFDMACKINDTRGDKARIIHHIRHTLDSHRHDFSTTEFNQSTARFLNPTDLPKNVRIRL
jgi:hypothetical protein